MKLEVGIKILLGLSVISFVHLLTAELSSMDFWVWNLLGGIIFWIFIMIFMDWRKWVYYAVPKQAISCKEYGGAGARG